MNLSQRLRDTQKLEKSKKQVQDKLIEVRNQLDKIEHGLDACQLIMNEGLPTQVNVAKNKVIYLLKNKQIYENFYDKLMKDQITIEVIESESLPKLAEEINTELEIIHQETLSIYSAMNKPITNFIHNKYQILEEDNKYTTSFVENLASRSYKVNIPEHVLDDQLQLIEDQFSQRLLQAMNTQYVPSYLDPINKQQKNRRISLQK